MSNSERPKVAHQMSLTGDGDGGLEPTTDSTATDLGTFFDELAAEDPRDYDGPRIERPAASTFGVDDRVEVSPGRVGDAGEQRALFADVDENQRTLDSGTAGRRWLFGDREGESR